MPYKKSAKEVNSGKKNIAENRGEEEEEEEKVNEKLFPLPFLQRIHTEKTLEEGNE